MAHFDVSMRVEKTTFPVKMYGGVPGRDGKSAYEVAKEEGFGGTKEEWLDSLEGPPGKTPQKGTDYFTPDDIAEVSETVLQSDAIKELQQGLADLQYEPIRLTGVYNSVGTQERGQEIKAIRISWALNKAPVRQTVDGLAIEASAREYTISLDPPLTWDANRSFEVTATDERELTTKGSTAPVFYNGVYYGVLTDGVEIDSAAVLGLNKRLQAGKGLTFSANAGSLQRIAYALPARYGVPAFWAGGFEGGFSLAKTFDFTNASGYTESYNVWLSDNTGLGSTTVEVK
jgi:hypothetical protein